MTSPPYDSFLNHDNHTLLFELLSTHLSNDDAPQDSPYRLKEDILETMQGIRQEYGTSLDLTTLNKMVITSLLQRRYPPPSPPPPPSPQSLPSNETMSFPLIPPSDKKKEDDDATSSILPPTPKKENNIVPLATSFYEKQAVIPQPDIELIEKKKQATLLIDSRNRNREEYPNANQYTIELPKEYRDVVGIELIHYDVPTFQYLIGKRRNNRLHYTIAHPRLFYDEEQQLIIDYSKESAQFIEFPEGYYTNQFNIQDFCTVFQSLLNTHARANYSVHYSERKNRLIITTDFSDSSSSSSSSNGISFFQLFFKQDASSYLPQSLGNMIGFPPMDQDVLIQGYASYHTTAEEEYQLRGHHTRFVEQIQENDWLYIVDLSDPDVQPPPIARCQVLCVVSNTLLTLHTPLQTSSSASTSSNDDSAMNKLLLWVGRIESTYMCNFNPDPYLLLHIKNMEAIDSTNTVANQSFMYLITKKFNFENKDLLIPVKYFKPILPRLDRLEIAFYNVDGSLYDFQGYDHVLVFVVNQLVQSLNYVQF